MNKEVNTILYIEEKKKDAEVLKGLLEISKHKNAHYVHVERPDEAFVHLANYIPDVLIAGLKWQEGGLVEEARKIKSIAEKCEVIILCNKCGSEEENEELLKEGIDIIPKSHLDKFTLSRAINYAMERRRRKRLLAETEIRSRSFLDEDLTGDYITTPDGEIIYCNNAFAQMLRYNTVEELKGLNARIFYFEEVDRTSFLEELKDKNKLANRETLLKAKDGAPVTVVENVVGIFDEKGNLQQITGYMFDITERKNYEKQLHDQTKLLSHILNIIPVGLWILDKEGNIQHANPEGQKIWGGIKHVGIDDYNEYKGWWLDSGKRIEAEEWGAARAVTKREISLREEIAIECFDGSKKIILNSALPVINSRNEIIGIIVTNEDITERKKTEAEIFKLSQAVDQSSVCMIITDPEGNIEYVNPFFTKITGYSFEEVRGKNPKFLQSGHQDEKFYKELWNTILSGKVWQGEFRNKKKNGELYWENAIITPVKNEKGEIVNFIAIKEDISEKKAMLDELLAAKVKAEEMNRVKSYFFANMSHELRTPLIGILGYSEILQDYLRTGSELYGMATTINESGLRLLETLNNILVFSKIEAEEKSAKLESSDIIPVVVESIKEFTSQARTKGIELIYNDGHDNLFCLTDLKQVKEVLNNLLKNAVKFTRSGSIEVSVQKENGKGIISVKDTGVGIPEEKQEIIWEPFRQVSEGIGRGFEGCGLGLAISKKCTEMIRGKLDFTSHVGEGTTFTLELPMA